MKKLLAGVAVLAPAIALLPIAPASADTVCLPITIDGQPVCQDTAPVDQAVAQAEATALGVVGPFIGPELDGTRWCDKVVSESDGVVATIGTYTPAPGPGYGSYCNGWELRIEASAGAGTTPAHIPQVCLTTTGTCVGGIDTSVPTAHPSYAVCLRAYTEAFNPDTGQSLWIDYGDPSNPANGACVPAA